MAAWTDAEIKIVEAGYTEGKSDLEISQSLPNRTSMAVESLARRRGFKRPAAAKKKEEKPYDPTDARILKLEAENEALKDEKGRINAQLKVYKKKAAVFQAVMEEVEKVVTPLPPLSVDLPISTKPKLHETEHVVLHLSDEHMDEVVLPQNTQGLEHYTIPIAMRRAENLVDTTLKLTQRTLNNYRFKTLWVLAYGDHTSGEIHNHVERSYFRNQFRNSFCVGQVHAQMFRDLAPYFENVVCVYVPGNHGRTTLKKDYHGAWDNWDYMVAETARLLCQDIPNIEFLIPDAFAINLNINEHVFAIEHGDDILSWNSIPFYGMERKSRRVGALHALRGTKVAYYVYGHFHKPSTLAEVGSTETIINGSWKATDPYVLGRFSGYTEPTQWLHGVHPEHGITWRFKVHLKSKDEADGPKRYRYNLADPVISG